MGLLESGFGGTTQLTRPWRTSLLFLGFATLDVLIRDSAFLSRRQSYILTGKVSREVSGGDDTRESFGRATPWSAPRFFSGRFTHYTVSGSENTSVRTSLDCNTVALTCIKLIQVSVITCRDDSRS